jgi:hypothetical protein
MRKKDDEFEEAERRAQRVAEAAEFVAHLFKTYQSAAATLHVQAEDHGIKDVKFMGTPRGVLAVEKIPGALKLAVARRDWPGGRVLREMIATEGYSKDSEILSVVPKQPLLGGSFIERAAENECRALLQGPVRKVSLFIDRWYVEDLDEWDVRKLESTDYPDHEWDEEDLPPDDGLSAEAVADMLAGGGYQIE